MGWRPQRRRPSASRVSCVAVSSRCLLAASSIESRQPSGAFCAGGFFATRRQLLLPQRSPTPLPFDATIGLSATVAEPGLDPERVAMPNVGSVLRDEIKRLSRREIRLQTEPTKKATTQNRHHIAELNRKVAQLERKLALLSRQAARHQQPSDGASAVDGTPKLRFVAKGLRSHRNRLGLSAGDFGRLVGVSANSVYAWEAGTTIPRRAQLAKIAALRTMGKREAAQRLSAATRATKRPKR